MSGARLHDAGKYGAPWAQDEQIRARARERMIRMGAADLLAMMGLGKPVDAGFCPVCGTELPFSGSGRCRKTSCRGSTGVAPSRKAKQMNNSDERDYEEEQANKRLLREGDDSAADQAWVAARDEAGQMTAAEADAYYTALETQIGGGDD